MEHPTTRKVLIINDNPETGARNAQLARRHGFEPVVARTTAEAMKFARTDAPHAAVIDWQLGKLERFFDFTAVPFNPPIIRSQVMDGRTPHEAYQYLRNPPKDIGERQRNQFKEWAGLVKIRFIEENGINIARNLLEMHPHIHIVIGTLAANLHESTAFKQLKEQHPGRVHQSEATLSTQAFLELRRMVDETRPKT